jgi:threonine dehydratase
MLQTASMQPPTIDDIRAARKRIDGAVVRTPMLVSRTLSEIVGAEVWLKFENLQFTAAYKERGALNKLLQLTPEERSRGVIAASAGKPWPITQSASAFPRRSSCRHRRQP